ncbi:carbohydrate ABC transporter permease [Microbacterium aurugineum]|uniref:carbohydrate ABC transporter permease n=1 Tax=Microbacterium aurugineum TaxID=2851642 RepID=UPI0020BD745F|nr:sugar ABC transporter permease [Microbacterium aurugineum]MCK8475689.1 sugar ABC transporter permease [Microbacterium aurugineum]
MTAHRTGRSAAGRSARTTIARRRARVSGLPGLAFIAPALVGLLALYILPLLTTVYLSFTETKPFGGESFTGIDNYAALVADPQFWNALSNSAIYTVIVLLGIPISIVIATLIHAVRRGKNVYRVLFFLPIVTLPVAVGMVWRYIFNGEFGLLNQALGAVGIDGPSWVADPTVAIFAVSIVGIWMSLGTSIIILGAGLQGVPPELLEASALDGAGPVRQFFSVTLPLLSPSIFFVSVLSVISSLQMFDLIYVMLIRGSQAETASQTIVYYFFQQTFVRFDRGYGSAIAIVLLLLIMLVTAVQFRLQRKAVFYG